MKDLINWIREVERLAGKVYLQASERFSHDAELKLFLEHMSEDEAWHYHVMGSAADIIESGLEIIPAVSIDEETSSKIVKYFFDIKEGLDNKTLSNLELLEKIGRAELSEWNDIFIYVINVLKDKAAEFRYPAVRIQAHIKEIEHFLEKTEGSIEILNKIKKIPPVWVENILIVEDDEMISRLIKAILNRDGNIDMAGNGLEAIELIDKKFYKLIISDIDMPVMDGFSLYKKARLNFPSLATRFLFITGNMSPEREAYLTAHGLKYLTKPIKIQELKQISSEIILSE